MEPRNPQPLLVALEWITNHCVIPDGFRKGQPFELYRYQTEYLSRFYLVRGDVEWVPANPILAPAFVFRRGLLVGSQKLGKNPLIAAQCCLEFVGPALFAGWAGPNEVYACADHGCRCGWKYPYDPGEPKGMAWPTPKIQITAFSEDSTENTYDALRPMISEGPLADVLPHRGAEFIRHPSGAEDARIDTVTSSNQSRLGQRVTFVPQDELGLWTASNKMEKLADTQYRGLAGMGGRASLTSNAWDPAEHSVAQREYESAAPDIYRQFVQPPKHLSYANKAERHRIHLAVYPDDVRRENGGHLDLNSIEAEAADLAAKDLPQAERFFGNRIVAGAGAAVEPDVWQALEEARDVPDGTYIGLGFEGSSTYQGAVLRACTADGYSFTIGAWVRPDERELLRWQSEHPDEQWACDRAVVREAVKAAFKRFTVGRMFADPWGWRSELNDWAAEFGEKVVLEYNTNQPTRMAGAVDRWLSGIREATHRHDADVITADHAARAHLKRVGTEDGDGRTKYVLKGEDGAPITAAIADALALEAAMTMPPEEPAFRSAYEDAGLTFAS